MGKNNTAVRQYLSDTTRFADIVNGTIFGGKQVVHPEELEQVDGESDVLFVDKEGNEKNVQRYRDITMRWKQGMNLVIMACENQEKVHYAMPVRTMLYDSLSYVDQIKKKWTMTEKSHYTSEEFLSKFQKGDLIYPVITIVLYYGLTEWDASEDLYGMFQIDEMFRENKVLQQYISNYKINLLNVGKIEHLENFKTDLQNVFGMLQYKSNTEKLVEYVQEHKDFFQGIDQDTYYAIRAFLHSENKLKKALTKAKENGEERVDMCKALDDLYNSGVEQGQKEGRDQEKREVANRLLGFLEVERIAEVVGLDLEVVKGLENKHIVVES